MGLPYGQLFSLPQAPNRINKVNGKTWGIQTYDGDNGYPQRMESIINACPTAKDTVKLFVKYLIGNGCTDVNFYKSRINATGLTPDKLLGRIARDFGKFGGFAIHVNYNALYQVDSVNFTPFKNCRLGIEPEYNGRIALHSNWYNTQYHSRYVQKKDIEYVWRFNSDPNEIERQVQYAGGWDKYNGQIYWYSPEVDDYPLSPFDEVIDPMMTEIKSNITTRNNVESNFQGKFIYIDKGEVADEDERLERNGLIQTFVGPKGNSVMIFESTAQNPDGKAIDVPEIIPIENKLNDALFKYTDDKTRGQIYRALQQNAVLHSDLVQGRYNQNQLPESQAYYNTLLMPDKLVIEDAFREIFSIFKVPINPTQDYSLIPLPTVIIPAATTISDNVNDPTNIQN